MPCYRPQRAWRSTTPNPSGKYPYVFDINKGLDYTEINLPCGGCIGCRIDRSKEQAMRCVHEARYHEENSYITLTYEEAPHSLQHTDWVNFIQKIRRRYPQKDIRYYMCGEYGEAQVGLGRPHFHAILFGHQFSDLEPYRLNAVGDQVYISPELEEIWDKGFCTVGQVTRKSAGYVARYIMKKINGDQADDHYVRLVEETGELISVRPEYNTMSKRPGIGHKWVHEFWKDCIKGYVTLEGKRQQIPRYYINEIEKIDKKAHNTMMYNIEIEAKPLDHPDLTLKRLAVREDCQASRNSRLKRKLQ